MLQNISEILCHIKSHDLIVTNWHLSHTSRPNITVGRRMAPIGVIQLPLTFLFE